METLSHFTEMLLTGALISYRMSFYLLAFLAPSLLQVPFLDWLPPIFLLLMIVSAVFVVRSARGQSWVLTLLPIGWLLLLISAFALDATGNRQAGVEIWLPGWQILYALNVLSAIAGFATVILVRNAPIFATVYAVTAGCFVSGAYFLASAALVGDYL